MKYINSLFAFITAFMLVGFVFFIESKIHVRVKQKPRHDLFTKVMSIDAANEMIEDQLITQNATAPVSNLMKFINQGATTNTFTAAQLAQFVLNFNPSQPLAKKILKEGSKNYKPDILKVWNTIWDSYKKDPASFTNKTVSSGQMFNVNKLMQNWSVQHSGDGLSVAYFKDPSMVDLHQLGRTSRAMNEIRNKNYDKIETKFQNDLTEIVRKAKQKDPRINVGESEIGRAVDLMMRHYALDGHGNLDEFKKMAPKYDQEIAGILGFSIGKTTNQEAEMKWYNYLVPLTNIPRLLGDGRENVDSEASWIADVFDYSYNELANDANPITGLTIFKLEGTKRSGNQVVLPIESGNTKFPPELISDAGNSNALLITKIIRYLLMAFLLFVAYKRKKLALWIFAAMIIGVAVGIDFPMFSLEMERLGVIFLRLIKSLVAPLIFATLVVGIAGHTNMKQLGRIGLKSILYFEIITTLALFVGLLAINVSKAGVGVHVEARAEDKAKSEKILEQTKEGNHRDHIVEIFPENIAKSIFNNEVLQIVVFSVIFAVGLGMVKHEQHKHTMLSFFEGLSEVMFKFTDIVMYIAPLAVFGALASTIAKSGVEILGNLLQLVGTLYVALIIFLTCILLPIALLAKVPVRRFIKAITEPVSLAFATASSEAALPKAMENMEKLGVSKKVVAFVIPTGYSFNLDGTTLYLSLATVFVAQMCGVDMTLGEQIGICLVLMLTSKGVAGVRGASFVILAGAVATIDGVDPQKASVILAVDALMDMARTSVNVIGNCLASVIIAKSEGEFTLSPEVDLHALPKEI